MTTPALRVNGNRAKWTCCQLGAREHYAVPRALHRRGELRTCVVDAWATPGSPWTVLPGAGGARLRERYSPDLADADVRDFTASLVAHEASWRLRGIGGWPRVMARNEWFQQQASREITGGDTVVFAHSYAALKIFQAAKQRGLKTVLGQIDPGEAHLTIQREAAQRWPEFGPLLHEPPPSYFSSWREECRLADRIVVNSEWSRDSLERAGIDTSKVRIVPLPFESGADTSFMRSYPAAFTTDRPLRVLFVGSVAAFKGVPSLLGALDHVGDAPVAITVVGPMAATIPDRFATDRRVQFIGSVSRSDVMNHYRGADVLVFPSLSDGFGMAQVEARGWRLPIIASRSSGRIVEDGVDGRLLPEVSDRAIAAALLEASQPGVLERWSSASSARMPALDAFGDALSELARD